MTTRRIIPAQRRGGETVAHKRFRSKSSKLARVGFAAAKARLLDVNRWDRYGAWTAFHLTNDTGKPVQASAEENFLIRVGMPGSGAQQYDWVRVEAIEQDSEDAYIGMRVQPARAPGAHEDVGFFTNASTNNFTLERKNNLIIAKVIGWNDVTRTESASPFDKMRNLNAVQLQWLGGSTAQWESFLEGIVNGRESRQ